MITQVDPISVIFTVPEDNVPKVIERLHAGAAPGVTVFDRDGSHQLASGRLLTLDNQIDTSTGTVRLRALFDNADLKLFPNQFVNARLQLELLHDAVTIPVAAVLRGAPGSYVYLVQADGTVTVRPVTLGPAQGETQVVTAGLEAGDKVVVDGTDRLREGAKVSLPEESPGAAGGGDAGGLQLGLDAQRAEALGDAGTDQGLHVAGVALPAGLGQLAHHLGGTLAGDAALFQLVGQLPRAVLAARQQPHRAQAGGCRIVRPRLTPVRLLLPRPRGWCAPASAWRAGPSRSRRRSPGAP